MAGADAQFGSRDMDGIPNAARAHGVLAQPVGGGSASFRRLRFADIREEVSGRGLVAQPVVVRSGEPSRTSFTLAAEHWSSRA